MCPWWRDNQSVSCALQNFKIAGRGWGWGGAWWMSSLLGFAALCSLVLQSRCHNEWDEQGAREDSLLNIHSLFYELFLCVLRITNFFGVLDKQNLRNMIQQSTKKMDVNTSALVHWDFSDERTRRASSSLLARRPRDFARSATSAVFGLSGQSGHRAHPDAAEDSCGSWRANWGGLRRAGWAEVTGGRAGRKETARNRAATISPEEELAVEPVLRHWGVPRPRTCAYRPGKWSQNNDGLWSTRFWFMY